MPMRPLLTFSFLLLISFGPAWCSAYAQEAAPPTEPVPTTQISPDQIRGLIREAAEKDMENDKKQRDYTYIQREEEHKLDGNDQVKSSDSKTYEIMVLYEEPVRKLIARDDKPLTGC